MQKDLLKTAVALRDHPASVLYRFQKTLSRPSYFLASPSAAEWVVLLGPRSSRPIKPKIAIRASNPQIQIQRIFRRILQQGSELQHRHAELKTVEACLELGRTAERTLRRVLRVQKGMSAWTPRGTHPREGQGSLYSRMLALQAQRFLAITRMAEETAQALCVVEHRQPVVTIIPAPVRRDGRMARRLRALHQWLMDPIIDTRERV